MFQEIGVPSPSDFSTGLGTLANDENIFEGVEGTVWPGEIPVKEICTDQEMISEQSTISGATLSVKISVLKTKSASSGHTCKERVT